MSLVNVCDHGSLVCCRSFLVVIVVVVYINNYKSRERKELSTREFVYAFVICVICLYEVCVFFDHELKGASKRASERKCILFKSSNRRRFKVTVMDFLLLVFRFHQFLSFCVCLLSNGQRRRNVDEINS